MQDDQEKADILALLGELKTDIERHHYRLGWDRGFDGRTFCTADEALSEAHQRGYEHGQAAAVRIREEAKHDAAGMPRGPRLEADRQAMAWDCADRRGYQNGFARGEALRAVYVPAFLAALPAGTPDELRLVALATLITTTINDGGAPTWAEVDEREALRRRLGRDWDSVNRLWRAYAPPEDA